MRNILLSTLILIFGEFLVGCNSCEPEYKRRMREQAERDSIEAAEFKHFADSLYQIDGERIMGNFYFGMSKSQFDTEYSRFKKAANAIVTIDTITFVLKPENCSFFHDQLYNLSLESSKSYEYVARDRGAYFHRQKVVLKCTFPFRQVEEYFSDKYGSPTDDCGTHYEWNFPYKRIVVSPKYYYPGKLLISFIKPEFEDEVQREKEIADSIMQSEKERRKDSIMQVRKKERELREQIEHEFKLGL